MLYYILKEVDTYIPDIVFERSILKWFPVPGNIPHTPSW